ncbi:hypothetical protein CANCADRAFT_26852 [Tortispora caseinolytica NRRL Y-17796]|uniref:Uncharacterized protein n=1 Tax=Tortispora caseinolytica NRRL Y-17796 TaxID=767744 RepID=A0A1E4TFT5_9ASCO|nr:hypothetical protein CANCADRAFT_26852 [Tortispora caseinolytica NRRL Y-17796]
MSDKRRASNGGQGALVKRQRHDRSSTLKAPVWRLTGHKDALWCCRFDPTGTLLATAGVDRSILIWNIQDGLNTTHVPALKGIVTDMQWSRDSTCIFAAAASTLKTYDLETGTSIRTFRGHEDVVNSVSVNKKGREMLGSCSDDGSVMLWDPRHKRPVSKYDSQYPVIAVELDAYRPLIYSAGVESGIRVRDLRTGNVLYELSGHKEPVSSLRLSADSSMLLSASVDSMVKLWDTRPAVPVESRFMKQLEGAKLSMNCCPIRGSFSFNNRLVGLGSEDGTAVIWDCTSGRLAEKLPGHRGVVHDVEFSPTEMVLATCSEDKCALVSEVRG